MTLGVVCGLAAEARALGALARHPSVRVAVTGARAGAAGAAARALVARGCTHLLSFGLAGGLAAALRPGDLLRPATVLWRGGGAALATPGGAGAIWGSDAMVLTARDKAALALTGALAVDMETHGLAQAAALLGVPVAALRCVADPADRDLPAVVVEAVDPRGRPRLAPVLRALARRPATLPALWRLKRDSDAGLAGLARAARDELPAWLDGGW